MTESLSPRPKVSSFPQQILSWVLRLAGTAAFVYALYLLQTYLLQQGPLAKRQDLVFVIVTAGIFVIAAVSLNLINGITGQFSLGHAGFMAVGAYASGAFNVYAGPRLALQDPVIFGLSIIAGAVAAGIAGLLVGLPSLRLRGDYLAIVTLGFNQIIISLIYTMDVIGAQMGLQVPKRTNFVWVFALAALCILMIRNVANSNLGRSMRAIRDDEIAAEASGINTTQVKVVAFVISSMWAGVAGALLVHYQQLAHPDAFSFNRSVEIVVMVVLGGLGSITGSAISAVVLKVLELQVLTSVQGTFWVTLILVILSGALSLPRHHASIARNGFFGVVKWLIWPVICLVGTIIVFRYANAWLTQYKDYLRYVIYALILVVFMLLRPQGLLGRAEFSLERWRRRG